jgi:hypothetical protein
MMTIAENRWELMMTIAENRWELMRTNMNGVNYVLVRTGVN